MNRHRASQVLFAILVLASVVAPVFAHHGDTNYDLKPINVTGTVTDFRFINPHIQVYFDVKDGNGKVESWIGQGTSPNMLVHRGWNKDTLKPGDQVTFTGYRAKNGSNTLRLAKILLNGEEIDRI